MGGEKKSEQEHFFRFVRGNEKARFSFPFGLESLSSTWDPGVRFPLDGWLTWQGSELEHDCRAEPFSNPLSTLKNRRSVDHSTVSLTALDSAYAVQKETKWLTKSATRTYTEDAEASSRNTIVGTRYYTNNNTLFRDLIGF